MKNLLFIFMFLILLSACATTNQSEQEAQDGTFTEKSSFAGSRSMSKELTFTEDSSFDEELSTAMRSGELVAVKLPKSVDPDEGEMPPQLKPWIAAVEKQGGKVDYEPMEGDMTELKDVVLQAFSFVGDWFKKQEIEEEKYASAKNYNARLCYQRDDNLVTKIVFVDKSSHDKPVCTYNANVE
jgi:hypothetical protein